MVFWGQKMYCSKCGALLIPAAEISIDTSDSIPLLEYEPFMKSMKGDSYT